MQSQASGIGILLVESSSTTGGASTGDFGLGDEVTRHGGRPLLTLGDALVAAFDDPVAAARLALSLPAFLEPQRLAAAVTVHCAPAGADGGPCLSVVRSLLHAGSRAAPGDILFTDAAARVLPPDFPVRFTPAASGLRKATLTAPVAHDQTVMPGATGAALAGPELVLSASGHHITLNASGAQAVLGRDEACQMVINNPIVSRRHAVVQLEAGAFVLSDQSRNGTFVQPDGAAPTPVMQSRCPLAGAGTIFLGRAGELTAALRYEVRSEI